MSAQPAPRRIAAWLAQGLNGVGPRTDFHKCLQDVCRVAGARHGSFTMRHVPGVVGEDPFHVDTYGERWRQHAEANAYALSDPLNGQSDRSNQPVDWSELPPVRGKPKRYFKDFNEFQLGRQALTVTFRGPLGDRSLLTLTCEATEKRWAASKHDIAAAMSVLHPALHGAVLRVRFGIEDINVIRLTPRERECLVWVAHGHTSKKIGENLGLTPATVNFFIDAAVGKLEASSRAHAAAKAVARGLIPPPR
jgi:DNA-binding CsgD family transcriptional regulator